MHGLNPWGKDSAAHAWDTWRTPAGEGGMLWLRDDLPNHARDARIFLYQYDSSAVYSESQGTFIDKANELLEAIRISREDEPARPLVLMGHSLGGILIEQALINARINKTYVDIYNATYSSLWAINSPLLITKYQNRSSLLCHSPLWRLLGTCQCGQHFCEDRLVAWI